MANWNLPTPASGYLAFVDEMNAKFQDVAQMLHWSGPINLPNGSIRFNRTTASNNFFEELQSDTTWLVKPIGIGGGGTGAVNAGAARTNLGLGSMATQNSTSVNITGGSITGVSLDVSALTGVVPLARGGTGSSLALGSQGSVLGSYGGIAQFIPGTLISNLNASSLSEGTVPYARLPTNLAYTNVVNQFVRAQRINNSGGDWPRLTFSELGGAADSKTWEINIIGGGGLQVWGLTDSESAIMTAFSFNRNGLFAAGSFQGYLPSNYITGIINPANLGSGAANSTTFLRGDNVWAVPPTGSGGGGGTFVPSGMIGIFDTNCPAGWTRYTGLDGRFPLGSSGAGATGGSNDHSHSFDVTSAGEGNHNHSFSGSFGGSGSGSGNFGGNTGGPSNSSTADAGGSFDAGRGDHTHGYNVAVNLNVNVNTDINSVTGMAGAHAHRVTGGTSGANHVPPYFTVVFCRKD